MPRKRSAGLPNRKQILDFIASSDQPAGKREIARAFGLSGQVKIDLKRLLKDMADEGLIVLGKVVEGTLAADLKVGMEMELTTMPLFIDDGGVERIVHAWRIADARSKKGEAE